MACDHTHREASKVVSYTYIVRPQGLRSSRHNVTTCFSCQSYRKCTALSCTKVFFADPSSWAVSCADASGLPREDGPIGLIAHLAPCSCDAMYTGQDSSMRTRHGICRPSYLPLAVKLDNILLVWTSSS